MAQTKNQTLTDLFNSPKLAEMLGKHNAGAGAEDLKSELFAVLCEKPDDFICGLAEKNQLLYYATAIVQRMIFTKGQFYRRYRGKCYEVSEALMLTDADTGKKELEEKLQKLDKAVQNDLHWVEKQLLRIYQRQGSIDRTAAKTKISERQVRTILSNARAKIITSMDGKLMGNYIVGEMQIVVDVPVGVTPENINDILEDAAEYIRQRVEGRVVPSANVQNCYVKKIEPIKLKKII